MTKDQLSLPFGKAPNGSSVVPEGKSGPRSVGSAGNVIKMTELRTNRHIGAAYKQVSMMGFRKG